MGERGIPRYVRAFITEHLSSMAQLEVLLLLRENADRGYSSDEVGETLRIDPQWAAAELTRLHREGLLSFDDEAATYRFAPVRPELERTVDGLAKAFATHRVSVITLLFSTPSDGIGSFADAFKIRRPDDG